MLIQAYADEVRGLDQYSIRKFADAFDVVPRTLCENSGNDPTALMHVLHSAHAPEDTANIGFNIETNEPHDSAAAGIYDIYVTKVFFSLFALELKN